MRLGHLRELLAVDIIGMPFYSSRHPGGSHFQGNQFDLGNPGLGRVPPSRGGSPRIKNRQLLGL